MTWMPSYTPALHLAVGDSIMINGEWETVLAHRAEIEGVWLETDTTRGHVKPSKTFRVND